MPSKHGLLIFFSRKSILGLMHNWQDFVTSPKIRHVIHEKEPLRRSQYTATELKPTAVIQSWVCKLPEILLSWVTCRRMRRITSYQWRKTFHCSVTSATSQCWTKIVTRETTGRNIFLRRVIKGLWRGLPTSH